MSRTTAFCSERRGQSARLLRDDERRAALTQFVRPVHTFFTDLP